MNRPGLALALLQRVRASGKGDGFRLLEVCPRDPARFLQALDRCLDAGFIERVVTGRTWHYRLTPAGADGAESGKLPQAPFRDRLLDTDPTVDLSMKAGAKRRKESNQNTWSRF